jgi:hypothetical protein
VVVIETGEVLQDFRNSQRKNGGWTQEFPEGVENGIRQSVSLIKQSRNKVIKLGSPFAMTLCFLVTFVSLNVKSGGAYAAARPEV